MLGKLIKHEFAATWRVMLVLSLILVGVGISCLCCFAGLAAVIHNSPDYNSGALSFSVFSIVGFLLIASFAVFILVKIYLVIRYYKNLYTAEGYLTFTLPASTTQIISAKVIVGTLWTLLTMFLLVIDFFCALFGFGFAITEPTEIAALPSDLIDIVTFDQSMLLPLMVTIYILSAITTLLSYYFCITVGQLWRKHKILGAILCYVGLSIVIRIVTFFQQMFSGFSGGLLFGGLFLSNAEFAQTYLQSLIGNLVLSIVLGVLYFLGCVLITKKRVNLD